MAEKERKLKISKQDSDRLEHSDSSIRELVKQSIEDMNSSEVAEDDQLSKIEAKLDRQRTRMEKIERLKELEGLLQKIESKSESEDTSKSNIVAKSVPTNRELINDGEDDQELNLLEDSIESGISKATRGEPAFRIRISDDEINKELLTLQSEIETEKIVEKKSNYELLLEIHNWVEQPQYGFMYAIPNEKKQKEDYESWREEWSQVLLDYAYVGKIHILYPKRLITEPPFSKFVDRTKAVSILAQTLIEKNLAKWWGKKPKKMEELRVYWKSNEEWKKIIFEWAKENAMLEVVMVNDIHSSGTDFANLPNEELKDIFTQVDKEKHGQMVELDEDQFGIKFNIF